MPTNILIQFMEKGKTLHTVNFFEDKVYKKTQKGKYDK